LYIYQEHELDEEDEDELHFLHDFFDFSSHALQSKVLLEEHVHDFEVEHEVEDEQDQPEEVEQKLLDWWCFFGNLAQLAFNCVVAAITRICKITTIAALLK
jgi:hypothetical protein